MRRLGTSLVALALVAQPALAQEATAPLSGIEAAVADPEYRCIVPLARAAIWQEQRAEPAFSDLPPAFSDRLDPFFSEVGNSLMDRFGLNLRQLDDLARSHLAEAADAFRNEPPGTIDPQVPQCIALVEAREAARPQPGPARCATMALYTSTSALMSDQSRGDVDAANGAIAAAMPGMLEWTMMRRRAQTMLRDQGMRQSEIDRLFDRERRAVERELEQARRNGRFFVYDRAACNRLLRPTSQTPAAAPAASPPESPTATD